MLNVQLSRGTGDTLRALCVPETAQRASMSALTPLASNASDATIGQAWAVKGSLAWACAKTLGNNATLLGTAFVARDMMRIVEGLGEDGLLHYWGKQTEPRTHYGPADTDAHPKASHTGLFSA
jgi:hypothetical protein